MTREERERVVMIVSWGGEGRCEEEEDGVRYVRRSVRQFRRSHTAWENGPYTTQNERMHGKPHMVSFNKGSVCLLLRLLGLLGRRWR